MRDVITLGSITIDVFLGTEAPERKGKLEYPVGTKILVKDVDFQTGGCGMNVAIGLRRLGCNTALLGKYGDDINGAMIRQMLKKEDVGFIGPSPRGKTGYSVILDSVKHNRTILRYRGASNDLRASDIKKQEINAKWMYIASSGGETFKTHKQLMDFVKRKKIKIAYNPGIGECRKGRSHIDKILKATYLIIMNRQEAEALTKKDRPAEMLKALRRMGPRIAVITNGTNDIFAYENGIMYTLNPHKIKVTEKTGAGDAFSSGLLAGLIRNKGIEYSMQLGMANSESVIRYFGAINKLLSWNEAAMTVNRRPGKIGKAIV
jgi:ribokinase